MSETAHAAPAEATPPDTADRSRADTPEPHRRRGGKRRAAAGEPVPRGPTERALGPAERAWGQRWFVSRQARDKRRGGLEHRAGQRQENQTRNSRVLGPSDIPALRPQNGRPVAHRLTTLAVGADQAPTNLGRSRLTSSRRRTDVPSDRQMLRREPAPPDQPGQEAPAPHRRQSRPRLAAVVPGRTRTGRPKLTQGLDRIRTPRSTAGAGRRPRGAFNRVGGA